MPYVEAYLLLLEQSSRTPYSETIEGWAFAEANRTELNTSSSRRTALELFFYFCVFFLKSSVRSKRTSKLTEYDAFKSWRYWIMLNWSNRTEFYTKKHKNNQKIRTSSGTVRREKIVRLSSVRFENLLKFDSLTVQNRALDHFRFFHIHFY